MKAGVYGKDAAALPFKKDAIIYCSGIYSFKSCL